jgi:hypothetical protein
MKHTRRKREIKKELTAKRGRKHHRIRRKE